MPQIEMSGQKMGLLKMFINLSEDASIFTKKVLIYLLDKTCGLTKSIHMPIDLEDREGIGTEIAFGIHNMCSFGGNTHLGELLELMGTEMKVFGTPSGVSISPCPYHSATGYDYHLEFDKDKIATVVLPQGKPFKQGD